MDDLTDILENHFAPRYCLENYSNIFDDYGHVFKVAFPMTCFCDLPLSQLHEHLYFYGGYGIGMRKEWGIRNKINPVLYMHQNSDLSDCIRSFTMELSVSGLNDRKKHQYLMKVIRHIKLYEGDILIDGRKVYKKFYDEREWRWVPYLDSTEHDEILSLTEDEFNDPDKRSKADAELSRKTRLDFGPGDIKYIVVSSEDEVSEMIDMISSFKGIYSQSEKRLLYTRILSSDQIKTDF